MSRTKNRHKNLTRRIFTWHLLFSLAAIATLLLGLVFVVEKTTRKAFRNQCRLQVNKCQTQLTIAFLCDKPFDQQEMIERYLDTYGFEYCAIVDGHGVFLAHTEPAMIDERYTEPIGQRSQVGEVEEVVFNMGNEVFRQFSMELAANGANRKTLKIAVKNRTGWDLVLTIGKELHITLLLTLVVGAIGAHFLRKFVMDHSEIEQQLKKLAGSEVDSPARLQQLNSLGATAVGWNQIISQAATTVDCQDIDIRLADALEAIKQKNEHELLEAMAFGIAETDAEGKITFINSAMENLLAAEAEDGLLGKPFAECLTEQTKTETVHALTDSRTYDRAGSLELETESATQSRTLKVTRSPIRDENNAPTHRQAWSARDITQLKLADKAREDFLDSATHEIRTPLANIKAYAETLAAMPEIDQESQQEFFNIINSEATRLSRFIDELLDVSSIEAGSLVIRRQKIELDRLLDEVVENVRPLMEKKEMEFVLDFDAKLPEIIVDKDKFATCLVNLLGNAAKYTESGGRIVFGVRGQDDILSFRVEDTGYGISKADQTKVFQKFFRSEDQRTLAETGNGLGLAFTNQVVQLHGGTITVESELNSGSVFTIRMPMEI